MYSLDEGKMLVTYARKNIESFINTGKNIELKDLPESFKVKSGVFVTLHTYPKFQLRGCIGFIEPVLPLIDAMLEVSISSALKDPRFPKVRDSELNNLIVEVTVLTRPEVIKVDDAKDYPENIQVGRDGLIVEMGYRKGLLLPQVPIEQGWNGEDFLCNTCIKAGLPPDCWMDEKTKVYKFSGQIFSETKPCGEIIEKSFME